MEKKPRHIGSMARKANRSDMKPPIASQIAVKRNDTAVFKCTGDINQCKPGYFNKHPPTAWGHQSSTGRALQWFSFPFPLSLEDQWIQACGAAPAADVSTVSSHFWIGSLILLSSKLWEILRKQVFLEICHKSTFHIISYSEVFFMIIFKVCQGRKKTLLEQNIFCSCCQGQTHEQPI